MAQLSAHPFIVTIFHADVSADGRPYFVMEYCSGRASPNATSAAASRSKMRSNRCATGRGHRRRARRRHPAPGHQAANVLTNDYGWPALTDFGISSNLEGELPVHTMTAPEEGLGTGSGPVGGRHERAVVAGRDVRRRPEARHAQ